MKVKTILIAPAIAALALAAIYGEPPQAIRPHAQEARFRNIRQLTFGGENAEAYFSFDGKRIIFQSTRAPYKCDQIFTMNADGSNVRLLS
ncbi:MAG: PD40 domain-containing protein, partial [Acidobacteria bacterium]|nr:PD40 domain-containing protein [Acidobacteriota bacterium]